MEADPRLAEHRRVWQAKPVLREIYSDYYARMTAWCVDGPTLEIGSGSGHIRERLAEVYMADILPAPWLDLAADAEALPVADAALANIVMLDVLHHIRQPRAFFTEAARVLRPGGRLVVLDPAITIGSWPVYRFMHPEPVIMRADPLRDDAPQSGADPFDSNQAVPTLLFGSRKRRAVFEAAVPDLGVVKTDFFGFAAYPLSGGFRDWSLLPGGTVKPFLAAERAFEPLLGRLFGFRLLAVLERR